MAKKEVTEFEAARRKRRAKFTFQRLKKLFGAGLIFVFIIGAVWLCAENDVFGIIGDKIAAASSGKETMPLEISGSSVKSIFECNGNIGVVTDGTLSLYATNGKTLFSFAHDMASPVAIAQGRRILLFDQGGTKLIIRTRDKVLFEKTFEYTIVNAELSKEGWLTVITTAQRYTSQLHVWDSTYEQELLTWSASEEYAVLAAADSATKTVAAVSITASDTGEIVTNLRIFTTESNVELGSAKFEDSAALSVAYDAKGNIKLICGNLAASVDREGNILGQYEFSGKLIDCVNVSGKSGAVLIFDRFTEARVTDMVFLDGDFAEKARAAVSGKFVSAFGNGEKTAVYCSGTLFVFSAEGKKLAEKDSEQDASLVVLAGDSAFAVTRNELCKID